MTRTSRDRQPDEYVQAVLDVLAEYETAHPNAEIEAYRQNQASLRIRIIDPDFVGMDRVDRESLVWKILERLPDDAQSEITLLLLLTPEETQMSFANYEFEHPVPSRL